MRKTSRIYIIISEMTEVKSSPAVEKMKSSLMIYVHVIIYMLSEHSSSIQAFHPRVILPNPPCHRPKCHYTVMGQQTGSRQGCQQNMYASSDSTVCFHRHQACTGLHVSCILCNLHIPTDCSPCACLIFTFCFLCTSYSLLLLDCAVPAVI